MAGGPGRTGALRAAFPAHTAFFTWKSEPGSREVGRGSFSVPAWAPGSARRAGSNRRKAGSRGCPPSDFPRRRSSTGRPAVSAGRGAAGPSAWAPTERITAPPADPGASRGQRRGSASPSVWVPAQPRVSSRVLGVWVAVPPGKALSLPGGL